MSLMSYDDRDGWIWFDGKLTPWREAKIHVLSHGLHYGSCVFEGQRAYDGKVFKLSEHSARLLRSAEMLGMHEPDPLPWTAAEIDRVTEEAVTASGLSNAYVRPVIWRGSEMMGVSAQKARPHLAVAVWDWGSYFSEELKKKGIALNISKWKRPSPESAPVHAKAAGLYMICTMSKHDAESKGFQDSLMYDYRGYIAEATGANIFLVINGEIHTPDPDCFLNGITRQTVIKLAQAQGHKVIVRHILPHELADATEVFLTGSAAEVTPVGRIDHYTFTPGAITHGLMEEYGRLVRGQSKFAV